MKIKVIRGGKSHSFQAEGGCNLMEFLLRAGMLEGTECAGKGICGKCGVIAHSGGLSPLPGAAGLQRLDDGRILSCSSLITGDLVIEVPASRDDVDRKIRLKKLGPESSFSDAPVEKRFISLTEPSLQDQTPDMERVLAQLGSAKKASCRLLQKLPATLRKSKFKVTAVFSGKYLIDVEPGDTRADKYGFAFDLGTTTIAGYLINLNSGAVLAAEGRPNPQRSFGSDVLSRITAITEQDDLLEKMRALILEDVSQSMLRLLGERGLDQSFIYSVVVVGNPTMSHIFLGIDPRNLALVPFIPCFRTKIALTGGELRLPMHPDGEVCILPNISGYVGSDTLGVILTTRMHTLEGYSLAVDIGTNGEIVLAGQGRLLACSAAAGPAFEGAHIRDGMRAGEGAVEAVSLEGGQVRLKVIGQSAPRGICGSGLIDAAAWLLRAGLMDARGRLTAGDAPGLAEAFRSRLREKGGLREFVLAFADELGGERDIAITQKDIRELQLAKGAIAAGIAVLAGEMGIEPGRIDRVFLAGAFGNYINRENVVTLGLFPGVTADKIIPVGNAAGEGAGLYLLSKAQRLLADNLAVSVSAVELSARADFNEMFMRELNFPSVKDQSEPGDAF